MARLRPLADRLREVSARLDRSAPQARNFLLAADVDAAAPEMTTAIARSEQLCTDLGLEELTELNAAMINQPENAWKAYMAIVGRRAPHRPRRAPAR